jgi:hypothetical protein
LGGHDQGTSPGYLGALRVPEDRRVAGQEHHPAHVLDVLNNATKKNGLTAAAEAKRTMSGVFGLAVSTLCADTDPMYPADEFFETILDEAWWAKSSCMHKNLNLPRLISVPN